jgi:hypothetical protein
VLRSHWDGFKLRVVSGFCLGGRHVADRFKETSVVEPVDPFEGCEFDRFEALPRTAAPNDLGFVESVDGLREGIIVAVADASDRGINPGLDETFGISNRHILLGFNWSSQRLCALPLVPRRVPRQVFASQASCAACC